MHYEKQKWKFGSNFRGQNWAVTILPHLQESRPEIPRVEKSEIEDETWDTCLRQASWLSTPIYPTYRKLSSTPRSTQEVSVRTTHELTNLEDVTVRRERKKFKQIANCFSKGLAIRTLHKTIRMEIWTLHKTIRMEIWTLHKSIRMEIWTLHKTIRMEIWTLHKSISIWGRRRDYFDTEDSLFGSSRRLIL